MRREHSARTARESGILVRSSSTTAVAARRSSQALGGIDVRALDEPLGRAAGQLLAAAGLADVIDAGVVLLARDGDEIVTVDLEDLEQLAEASGRHVELIHP